jgi:hypothetical protein
MERISVFSAVIPAFQRLPFEGHWNFRSHPRQVLHDSSLRPTRIDFRPIFHAPAHPHFEGWMMEEA